MCLLKGHQTTAGCNHSECKNYHMFNKQFCIHSFNNAKPSMENLSNFLLPNQNQPVFLQPSTMQYTTSLQQTVNAKRLANLSGVEHDGSVSTLLNKKKVKLEEGVTGYASLQTQSNSSNSTPKSTMQFVVSPQSMNLLTDNRSFLSLGSISQNITRNSSLKTSGLQDFNGAFEREVKIEHFGSMDGSFREFQIQLQNMISMQSKMLVDLNEKNELIQESLTYLTHGIKALKDCVDQNIQPKHANSSVSVLAPQNISNSGENATAETLINHLYGPKSEFQYQLVLETDMALPLYRERNISFTVLLIDQQGKPVANANKIPLTIGIYSSENPPKHIDINTAGNKILKGFIEKDLVNGTATFEKIQIKEVTSHFRNGWIFVVVYPKITKEANNNVLMRGNGVNINMRDVRPLILEKVVVKAKKMKE